MKVFIFLYMTSLCLCMETEMASLVTEAIDIRSLAQLTTTCQRIEKRTQKFLHSYISAKVKNNLQIVCEKPNSLQKMERAIEQLSLVYCCVGRSKRCWHFHDIPRLASLSELLHETLIHFAHIYVNGQSRYDRVTARDIACICLDSYALPPEVFRQWSGT